MKTSIREILAAAMALALASCNPGGSTETAAHDDAEAHEETETGVTFKINRGLHVPQTTARFIDLKTAEVEERRIASEFRFSAQVYRGTNGLRPVALAPKPASRETLASADISPEEARLLRRDQPVRVQLDNAALVRGRVLAIDTHTEKSGAHADVTIAVDDPEGQLRPGSFVNVIVPVGGETAVASVPRRALLRTAEGEFVYTRNGEHFVRTPVKTGAANDEHVEISDGLYPGDEVVVNPVMTLWMAELQSIRGGKACADGH